MYDNISLILLVIRNVSDKIVEKIKTHILCSMPFFENRAFYKIMWKNIIRPTGNRWQYNTAHALCMLVNLVYRHTLRMCNTYCFSTATVVTRKRLKVRYTYSAYVFHIFEKFHLPLRLNILSANTNAALKAVPQYSHFCCHNVFCKIRFVGNILHEFRTHLSSAPFL
jgi:hypothetical protein